MTAMLNNFMMPLKTFGLAQHVTVPTHKQGHTLDVLITKGVDIPNINVVDPAISNHFCLFFEFSVTPKPAAINSAVMQKRFINDNTRAQFIDLVYFEDPLCLDLSALLTSYSSSVLSTLNSIAPVKTGVVKNKQKAPWCNEVSIRAESGLQGDFEIHKAKLVVFNHTVRQARESYFSKIISN